MVQRYEFELYHCNGGDMSPDDNGAYVSYEDYAELRSLLFRMTDSVNLSELPEGLYDDLEVRGLL